MSNTLTVGDDGSNTLQGTVGKDLIYGFDPDGPQGDVSSIAATRVANGLSQPLFVGAPPGDSVRLFIVEKTGQIKILDLTTGQVQSTPFLDVSAQISTAGESGLLGLAFHPDYASNGLFYVYLINSSGDTEVRSYHVQADNGNVADAVSNTLILTIDQPSATNHKAGWLGFGPDEYLYVAVGDGGANSGTGQDINDLLGNILRIDVKSDAFPADATRNYAIPSDNPFAGATPGADEIYVFGLRNPWRDSFDRGLGDFYIADVGQNTWEEIDLGQLGANYGWNVREGPDPFVSAPLTGGSAVAPIYFYDHSVGSSITGGYVYRGTSEGLQGHYFFADFSLGKIFTLHFENGTWVATDRTSQINEDVGSLDNPSSFGEDGAGNLYVADIDGEVFRLTPTVTSADQGDNLSGLGGEDMMFGGSGNDTLDGGTGADAMTGGAGNDSYFVDSTGDLLVENTGDGSDTVYALLAFYMLPANAENLVLLGGINQQQGIGNSFGNAIYGNTANNTLDGRAGADAMYGGVGNDSYFVDNAGDVVVENVNEGSDTVYSTAHLRLGGNVENLVLQGSADLQGFGNNVANAIYGNNGSNILDGDVGADLMVGGLGDDAYCVDNAGDTITENANEGTDTVYSTAHLRLTANLENLLLRGGADLQGFGNGLSNAIYGDTGNNLLDGDAGADSMYGGRGNDTYYVDNIADVVVENANEGFDTVYSNASLALAINVETLLLQGNADLQGYGNGLDNAIYGNSGNNLLNGGVGGDSMYGGTGNDVYYVDNIADVIVETANEGNDTVFSTTNLVLGTNVEMLVLLGSDDLQGYGNSLSNAIYGNSGNNVLDGGVGADALTGNAGNDTFVFHGGEGNGDTVIDFDGNGAAAGDALLFVGYGVGATFTNVDSTHWQLNYNSGASHDMVTFSNGAAIDANDYLFN